MGDGDAVVGTVILDAARGAAAGRLTPSPAAGASKEISDASAIGTKCPTEPASGPWLTLPEVGQLLVLSRAAAYRLPLDPSFPATRVGRVVRVERAGLERWLRAHTQRSRRAT